jgi:hypothetical protein
MREMRKLHKTIASETEEKKSFLIIRRRWKDNIKIDLPMNWGS